MSSVVPLASGTLGAEREGSAQKNVGTPRCGSNEAATPFAETSADAFRAGAAGAVRYRLRLGPPAGAIAGLCACAAAPRPRRRASERGAVRSERFIRSLGRKGRPQTTRSAVPRGPETEPPAISTKPPWPWCSPPPGSSKCLHRSAKAVLCASNGTAKGITQVGILQTDNGTGRRGGCARGVYGGRAAP
jgi:hypothetical protein